MASILIVDDDLVSRVLVRHIVADLGHDVTEAGDAEEAVEQLAGESFDLVLCDQEMPGMTGIQLRAHLGAEFTTPFVLLTGYAEADELTSEAGTIDGHLTKPVSSADLGELIKRLLEPVGDPVDNLV